MTDRSQMAKRAIGTEIIRDIGTVCSRTRNRPKMLRNLFLTSKPIIRSGDNEPGGNPDEDFTSTNYTLDPSRDRAFFGDRKRSQQVPQLIGLGGLTTQQIKRKCIDDAVSDFELNSELTSKGGTAFSYKNSM